MLKESKVKKIESFLANLGGLGATYRDIYKALEMTPQQLQVCIDQMTNVCEDNGRLFIIKWVKGVPFYAL